MNSNERILAVLNRQPMDRLPVDLWHTPEIGQSSAWAGGSQARTPGLRQRRRRDWNATHIEKDYHE